MAKNSLVINIDIREIRVALIEDGILVELHLERDNARGTLGNVYLGKVSRVLPGMQAAFIDIGQERAAFLHVEDLIRPDDFEAYLAGQRAGTRHHDEDTRNDASANPIADDLSQPALPVTTNGHAAGAHDSDRPARDSDAEAASDEAASDEGASDEAEVEGASGGDAFGGAALSDAEDEGDDVPLADPSPTPEESVSALAAPLDADDDGWSDGDDDDADADAPADEAVEAVEAVETASDDDADDEDDEDDASDDVAEPTGEDEVAAEGAAVEGSEAHAEDGSVDVELEEEGAPGEALADGSVDPTAEGAEGDAGKRAPRARSRRGRGRRRSGKTADRRPLPPEPVVTKPAPREAGRRSGKDDKRRNDPLRVSKSTPIREVVREGQEVIVQVSKEPIGTKGARVTSHISLPGRYVVYLPTVEHVGISKRIGSDKERSRLREAIDAMKPPTGGLIVRTLAEGLTKKSLKSDVGYLVRLWGEIAKNRETARAPDVLYSELDLVLRTARDLFTDDIEEIVIDNRDEYVRLRRFIDMFMPERAASIRLYEGDEPIFDAYGIEDEIGRALSRKVPLPSGGHLIIDQAEALTAIDVNTGRFVGKGSRDLEDTILQTNLEAVEEIAYQLRFRNIGGLIILDLIDMERTSNREKVRRKLEQILLKDKAKTTLNRISELGLIEMTRKRTRESLGRQMNEPCFYCDGTGNLQSKQTVALEILRQIKREKASLRGYSVVVNAHPAIVDLLRNEEREAVTEAERKYMRRIELVPRREYHLEQFDLVGK